MEGSTLRVSAALLALLLSVGCSTTTPTAETTVEETTESHLEALTLPDGWPEDIPTHAEKEILDTTPYDPDGITTTNYRVNENRVDAIVFFQTQMAEYGYSEGAGFDNETSQTAIFQKALRTVAVTAFDEETPGTTRITLVITENANK